MAAGDPKKDDGPSSSLEGLKAIAGLFAGAAALIYLTGSAVLAFRLLFAGIPSLGVVPSLPREFLFSLGATNVVAPAVLIGAALGVVELGQSQRALELGHLPWWRVQGNEELRTTYLRFYAAAPIVLLAPGAAVSLARNDEISHKPTLLAICASCVLIAVVALARAWKRSGIAFHSKAEVDAAAGGREKLHEREWPTVFAGCFISLIPAVWAWAGKSDTLNYFGLTLAWLLTLLVVLLFVWLRAQIGERFRDDRLRHRDRHETVLTVLSWAATAVLAVPALVSLAAALPLQEATVCTKSPETHPFRLTGRYVGETKERVYVGDEVSHRVISIPSDEVRRVTFGKKAPNISICDAASTAGLRKRR